MLYTTIAMTVLKGQPESDFSVIATFVGMVVIFIIAVAISNGGKKK